MFYNMLLNEKILKKSATTFHNKQPAGDIVLWLFLCEVIEELNMLKEVIQRVSC